MKLLYIDKFEWKNSNLYWLKYFQRALGKRNVLAYDLRHKCYEEVINSFRPDQIHLGGSVKAFFVPIELLKATKRKYNARITSYYGDAAYSQYHEDLAKVVDFIGFTNDTYPIKINEAVGRNVCHYLKPPTDPKILKPYKVKKEYDVIFIGNNYGDNSKERNELLEKIKEEFKLSVFGKRWKDGYKEVYGKQFAKVCSQAKIAIDIFSFLKPFLKNLKYYFSNRLVNTMACGCFFIVPYTAGMEDLFRDGHHLSWYKTEEELLYWIKFFLEHDEARERIAKQGREYVIENFTYEKNVNRFLSE